MKDIEQVIIGSNVERLEDGLFENLVKLKNVDFINAKADLVIPARCFKGCIKLEEINLY